jgi:tRNA pseudouridine55 synthase
MTADAFGFLNIDKPLGMTSHDVVAKVRRVAGMKRVGHAGTLDPLATGVLILCLGNATRLSEYVMNSTKRYRARVHLGITTDTYDAEGDVLLKRDASHIMLENVEAVLSHFLGDIEQVPPMYSAIKQGGHKLYELARAGETVEREARPVHIDALTISQWQPPQFTLDVTCSAGTYIRSLAYDIGEALGVGAHLAGLVRLASGSFTREHAVPLDTLVAADDWRRYLISPADALHDWPAVSLNAAEVEHIRQGRAIDAVPDADALALGYAPDGTLIGLLRADGSLWRPHKVFS